VPEQPPLPRGELERVLSQLEPLVSERRVVLVGGQAVAFWAEYLSKPGLELTVVATKDIDFEGARTIAQRAGKLLDAKVKLPRASDRTPLTGVVTFVDSAGHERELDFIESPRGLSAQDVRDTAIQVAVANPAGGDDIRFWVMHPERSMESRVHNVVELRRTGSISMSQLEVSIDTAREWSRRILGDDSLGLRTRQRAVLDLNERIFRKCRSDNSFKALYRRHGTDPFEAVLVDDRLPKQFNETRYPQMVAALEAKRGEAKT
jgi:hypothetical protein